MAKFALLTLLCAIALASANDSEVKRYDGYRVYHVTFTTDEQFNILFQLDVNGMEGVMFWQLSHGQHWADIMVAPHQVEKFESFLNAHGFSYTVRIDDVQKTIQ